MKTVDLDDDGDTDFLQSNTGLEYNLNRHNLRHHDTLYVLLIKMAERINIDGPH